MARGPSRIPILRPLVITVSAFLLALAIERFSFPSISLTLSAGNGSHRVVYSELTGVESTLWIADPMEPGERRRSILTVNHQTGYGVVASVSADGVMLAYGFLPVGRTDAFSEGQLWVSTIDGQKPRLISSKMDLHFPPVWSPDGRMIMLKTVEDLPDQNPPEQKLPDQKKPGQKLPNHKLRYKLVVVPIDDPVSQKTVIATEESDLYPVGWSQDGRGIYYYSLDSNSAQASLIDLQTSETTGLGKLDDGPVWNVRLSPDYRRFLFVGAERTESGNRGSVRVFDIENRRVSALSTLQDGPVGAIWHPSGTSVTRNGSLASGRGGQAVLSTDIAEGTSNSLREESTNVTSIPVSWSPDAVFLVVRRRSLAPDGRVDNLAVLDSRTGQLREIKGGYAEVVGWTSKAK